MGEAHWPYVTSLLLVSDVWKVGVGPTGHLASWGTERNSPSEIERRRDATHCRNRAAD